MAVGVGDGVGDPGTAAVGDGLAVNSASRVSSHHPTMPTRNSATTIMAITSRVRSGSSTSSMVKKPSGRSAGSVETASSGSTTARAGAGLGAPTSGPGASAG